MQTFEDWLTARVISGEPIVGSAPLLYYAELAKNQPSRIPQPTIPDPLSAPRGIANSLGLSLLCWAVVLAVFAVCVWARL